MSLLTLSNRGQRQFSIADVAAMPRDLPSGPVDYELENGRLVTRSVTGRRHGAVQGRLATLLINAADARGRGMTLVEAGLILWRSPDRLVGPDVAYFPADLLPVKQSPEGFVETMPALVIEVRSKNDSDADVDAKAAHYLRAGVPRVLVADPQSCTVTIHAAGGGFTRLGPRDTLRLPEVAPDCEIGLEWLFRD